MARLPRRMVPEPGRTLLEIVDGMYETGLPLREAALALQDDALNFRLHARRYRFWERVADSVAKLGGGSLLTATIAMFATGHGVGAPIAAGFGTVTFFTLGTILAALMDYQASAWDLEAERANLAAAEIGGGDDD